MRKPKLAAQIAKELHRFHQVEIAGSREPQLWNDIFKFYEKGCSHIFMRINYMVLCTLSEVLLSVSLYLVT